MVHLGPLTEPPTPKPVKAWSKPHQLHMFRQVEQRPGEGSGWMEAQSAGLIHLLCNCGYSTGWIPEDQTPNRAQLLADHGVPFSSVAA